tara:strand:- start:2577 stop:3791 length:1215 start_codon:yes stop_codon:yes gene_type:complete
MFVMISSIILLYLIFEIILKLIITVEKKNIQWLLTNKDKYPTLNKEAVKKFINSSFHPELGWYRKPGSTGEEVGVNGKVFYSIDTDGSRKKIFANKPTKIATFGDSFAFCRQVNDEDTWQSQISKRLCVNIQNFGVGNYGLDQAFLRFNLSRLSKDTNVIIVMFVPETICRIQSQWKHYLEFGNTFAFKPMFKINSKNKLNLIPNPIKNEISLINYNNFIKKIQKDDRFYKEKFLPSIIKFPFTLNLCNQMSFKSKLTYFACLRFLSRIIKRKSTAIDNKIMHYIIHNNLRFSHTLYKDITSRKLLSRIISEFDKKATINNKKIYFVITPQLLDLKIRKAVNKLAYENFYHNLKSEFNIVDLTKDLFDFPLDALYVNDIYGGHLSVYGNKVVSKLIESKISINP